MIVVWRARLEDIQRVKHALPHDAVNPMEYDFRLDAYAVATLVVGQFSQHLVGVLRFHHAIGDHGLKKSCQKGVPKRGPIGCSRRESFRNARADEERKRLSGLNELAEDSNKRSRRRKSHMGFTWTQVVPQFFCKLAPGIG